FGLAAQTSYLRVETRARNAITTTWPDADGTKLRKGTIAADADALMFGPHTAKRLPAAPATGIDPRASRDAGSDPINVPGRRAIEATQHDDGPHLAAFIHIPPLARDGMLKPGRIGLEGLVDAGEAMLAELVKLTRGVMREVVSS